MTSPYGTSLIKAFRILEFLGTVDEPANLSEIADGTSLTRSTTFKVLNTLQDLDLVDKSPSHTYSLGIGLFLLVGNAWSRFDVVRWVHPFLEELNSKTRETVHLTVEHNSQVIYLAKLDSDRPVRMYSQVGVSAPLYCTAVGKSILSMYSDVEFDEFLDGVELHPYTSRTITSGQRLREEINQIKKRGYAIDNMEFGDGVKCVAVSFSIPRKGRYAVSISTPAYRLSEESLRAQIVEILDVRRKIIEQIPRSVSDNTLH